MLTREKKAKLNIIVSITSQFISVICGLIAPRYLLATFGSEQYGATTSITQFLAYISLLEGGVGGVARAALYRPLAEKNTKSIGNILYEVQHFFTVVGCIFAVYVLALGCVFKKISALECFDWLTTFLLVLVISISTFGQYFIGLTNSVLLQASQQTYIVTAISSVTLIVNTVMTVLLVKAGFSLIIIKLVSSVIFFVRPLFLRFYVKKSFPDVRFEKSKEKHLTQKWTGLGQHLAYFLHSNTDVMVLTLFSDLKIVAVYAVYNMVISHIQSIVASFSTGMESIFGDMLAKKEYDTLKRTMSHYETLISIIAIIMFSCTMVLIVPFVSIYTRSITDINYIYPAFSILITLASLLTCLRQPYHSMTIAAGHFIQTKKAAYGEAVINIVLSIVLVIRYGLIGVAIGTVAAVLFRYLFYVFYLSKNIVMRSPKIWAKRFIINLANIVVIFFTGSFAISHVALDDYLHWFIAAVAVGSIAFVTTVLFNYVFYRDDFVGIIKRILRRQKNPAKSK